MIALTFYDGGFYRVDLDDKISIISLNTLYYDYEGVQDYVPGEGKVQMDWLERQL